MLKVIEGEKTKELFVGRIISSFIEVDKPGVKEIRFFQNKKVLDGTV